MSPIVFLPVDKPILPTAYDAAVLLDTPSYYCKMNDAGVPLVDEQGCVSFSTEVGSVNYAQSGKNNLSIQGAGGYIHDVGTPVCASPGGNSSYEAIIRRNGAPAINDEYYQGDRDNAAMGVQAGTGFLQARFTRSTGGGPVQTITTTFNVCDNNWHHVVITVNLTTWTFWVDGVSQGGVGLNPVNTAFGNAPLSFFVRYQNANPWAPVPAEAFQGWISSAAYWRVTVLNGTQVGNHYAAYLAL